jgi:hypothetical protein
MKRKAILVLIPLGAFWSLASSSGGPDYTRLDASAERLRSAFNADPGKVRVVTLVAPT